MPSSRLVKIAFWTVCLTFVGLTLIRAASRPLWHDELYTLYIAQMASPSKIWTALRHGVDLNPPLFYLLTKAGQLAAPQAEVGTRLPAIAGFLLLIVCLYRIVARRLPAGYAFLAMLIPLAANTYWYSLEARGYGVMLGCTALSFYCWQTVTSERRRPWQLLALAAAILIGLLSHCFAVMMMPALGLGELVRTIRRRKIDWSVWLALLVPCTAVLTYLPLLNIVKGGMIGGLVYEASYAKLAQAYLNLLAPAVIPAVLGLMILAYGLSLKSADIRNRWTQLSTAWPVHERVAAATYLAIPLIACAAAMTLHSGFFARYGAIAAVGFSMIAASAAFLLIGHNPRRTAVLPAVIFLWFAGSFVLRPAPASTDLADRMPSLSGDLPIVISNGLMFLERDHYADDSTVLRSHFLVDADYSRIHTHTDMFDMGYPVIKQWFPIRGQIDDYAAFTAAHPSFIVYGTTDHPMDWLVKRLTAEGFQLEPFGKEQGVYGNIVLLIATRPPASASNHQTLRPAQ